MPEPGNPQSLNRYAYANNNPLKYTDPTGHNAACAPLMGSGPLGVLAALGCEVGYAVASYGPQLIQLAANLSQFAASPSGQVALQLAQQANAGLNQVASNASNAAHQAASQAGNTAGPGGLGPGDPWRRFSELIKQGVDPVEAAVRASTQGEGDRFVIGPYKAPPGTLNYIDEATQHGGKYFDAGNKLWDVLAEKGLTEQVNRQVIYEQMKAGISRIDISSGMTIDDVLQTMPKSWTAREVMWIDEFAREFGYIRNVANTGWLKAP